MGNLLQYDIFKEEIAHDLMNQGFKLISHKNNIWKLESPPDISSTKARKIISICIKLHKASKEFSSSQKRFENSKKYYYDLVDKLNAINLT